jgi:hypothetical protein
MAEAAEGTPESNPFAKESMGEAVEEVNLERGEQHVPLQPLPVTASTIDEPVSDTLARDAKRIALNLAAVLAPGSFSDPKRMLREWDLWGPLICTLALGLTLALGGSDEDAFPVACALIAIGTLALSANIVLLGGHIIPLQALSLLGYCLFPLLLAAIVAASLVSWQESNKTSLTLTILNAAVLIVTAACVFWSSAAAVPFVSAAVPSDKRVLAVYPVVLVYGTIAWLNLATLSA